MTDHNSGQEFSIISKYFRPLAEGAKGALGLLDDAALIQVPRGQELVITTDALVGGVHFLESLSPQDIAHKVVGANLSDLAAMGAMPRAVFLAAQFSQVQDEAWIAAFADGLKSALAPSGAKLMGGDTVSTPGPMAFTLTALGHVASGHALKRSGACPGDLVFVTGTIGDGALGLAVLRGQTA
ncbi:MAG: thiamine-phosphate kinase, partial [Magnetovibrio sp.]|nr:thiamine-phosphate kinase [Magnetovibrio sp.]